MKGKEEGEHSREGGEELDPKAQGATGREEGAELDKKPVEETPSLRFPHGMSAELFCVFHSVSVSQFRGGLLKAARTVSAPGHTDRHRCADTVHLTGSDVHFSSLSQPLPTTREVDSISTSTPTRENDFMASLTHPAHTSVSSESEVISLKPQANLCWGQRNCTTCCPNVSPPAK